VGAVATDSTTPSTTHPLDQPRGLAVDAKGNLYVANQGANQILIYSPNYVQQTAKTITANISKPTSVAFDPAGNLWVANYDSLSITEYAPNGTQIVAGTITEGITGPNSLAVDGLGDIWVQNNFSSVNIYAFNGTLLSTFIPESFIGGIAVHNQWFDWGGTSVLTRGEAATLVAGKCTFIIAQDDSEGLAAAFDNKGDLYVANATDAITFYDPNLDGSVWATLSFSPEGIAVDSVRGRVYVSDQSDNAIAVYGTNGVLLRTIQ
jgi:DNA-binding beta-propeller fold protein YncE